MLGKKEILDILWKELLLELSRGYSVSILKDVIVNSDYLRERALEEVFKDLLRLRLSDDCDGLKSYRKRTLEGLLLKVIILSEQTLRKRAWEYLKEFDPENESLEIVIMNPSLPKSLKDEAWDILSSRKVEEHILYRIIIHSEDFREKSYEKFSNNPSRLYLPSMVRIESLQERVWKRLCFMGIKKKISFILQH